MDLRDSGRARLRPSPVLIPARTEPRPPKYTFPDSQDHARSFRLIMRRAGEEILNSSHGEFKPTRVRRQALSVLWSPRATPPPARESQRP